MYKKVLLIMGIVLIIILFFIIGTPKYQSMKIKSEDFSVFRENIKEAVEKHSEIDINNITDFEWDECYVFSPYSPSDLVYEKVGTEWTGYKTFIKFLVFHKMEHESMYDSSYLIVFKKGDRVVLSRMTSANEINVFFEIESYIEFTSKSAVFLVKDQKLYNKEYIKKLVRNNN